MGQQPDKLGDTGLSVPVRVARTVATSPDSLALIGPEGEVTYGQLWQRAARFAAAMPPGTGPDTVVGIVLPRGADLVAAQLGVWLAGAAFVPLDPALPVPRLVKALQSAAAVGVITTGEPGELLAAAGMPLLRPRPVSTPVPPPDPGPADPGPADLAYIVSTSGSTGTPKSVALEHGNLTNLVDWFRPEFEVTSNDRALFATGPGFDVSMLDIWGALSSGAAIVLTPDDIRRDVELLLGWMNEKRVTQCLLPTPVGEALLRHGGRAKDLRWMGLLGDVMRVWPEPDYPAEVFNIYGPSETTVLVTVSGDLRKYPPDGLPPIGRPVAGATMRVLHEDGRVLTEPGQAGELWIGGPGVGRGYLNHEIAGAPSPFGPAPWGEPGRWYRSGDICAWTAAGELQFLGRKDRQVKVRGHRIELAEIEQTMLGFSGVRQAAVLLDGAGEDVRIVGYVVADCEVGALRRYLQSQLPAAMVPAQVRLVPEIPLNPNGKIDRAALSAIGAAQAAAARASLPGPRTAAERAVMEVWESVLRTPVGREDDFFDQGGDSLSGIRVIARLRDQQGYSASLGQLLTTSVLHEFAGQLVKSEPQQAVAVEVAADGDGEIAAPLSDAQKSFWSFVHGKGRGTQLWEMLHLVHLSGELDPAALAEAIDTVAARHEALRSTVSVTPDETVQIIHPPAPVPIETHDVAGTLAEVCDRARQDQLRPLDLTREKPFRVALYRFGPAESVLALVTHHMFFDGQSASILLTELGLHYSARVTGRPAEPPAAVPYRDYVESRSRLKTAATTERHLRFWREYLRDFDQADLPTDFERPQVPTFAADEVAFDVPPEALRSLSAFCARNRVTNFAALVGAFASAVSQVLAVDDLLVGVSVAHRRSMRHEAVIGELTNTLPLRFDLRTPRSLPDICLGAARDFGLVDDFSDIHYRALLPELSADQGFELRFSLNDARAEDAGRLDFAGVQAMVVPVRGREKHSNRDLRLDVWDGGSRIQCVLTFRSELFRKEPITRLSRLMIENLAALDTERSDADG